MGDNGSGAGSDHDRSELRAAASNVRIEQVISHAAVLKRGTLLVSHAGHGSVMKALWFGRSMVLVPWSRDQPGVAARAGALGVAVVIPREVVSVDALSETVDHALADERMKEVCRSQGARLRSTDPPAAAASLLEELL